MSKFVNSGIRMKNARETYVEQLPYGRGLTGYMNTKRKPFTHLKSTSDADFAYQSTPEYLRQLAQENSPAPSEMMFARNIPRTRSASELTPRNNLNRSTTGNPKYKAQEDYYDEIQSLKKDMKTLRDENSTLRAKVRRSEEDNARKRKEIDALYDTSKDGDLRRTLSGSTTDRNNNNNNNAASNVVMSLKQRIFKLELQLKQKETTIDEVKSDPKWTKGTELEIQNRALFGEIERQKVERLNYIQQNDYTATIDEEAKNAVRKLNKEKDELKKENESLHKKLQDFNKTERSQQLSARSSDGNNDKQTQEKLENLQEKCNNYKNEVERLKNDLEQTHRKSDQFRDKLKQANEDLEEIKRDRNQIRDKLNKANEDLEEIRHNQHHKKPEPKTDDFNEFKRNRDSQFSKKNEHTDENFDTIHEYDKPTKVNQPGRSSPALKRDEDQHRESPNLSTTRIKRPQSPTVEKQTPRSSNTPLITAAKNKPSEIQSPRSSFKVDNLGSGTTRPSSANTTNESALKTVQASLRGHLNRTEIDKTRDETSSPPPRARTPTRMDKSERIQSDDEDSALTPAKQTGAQYGSEKKRDGFHDQPKSTSKQSLPNDKIGSNNQLPLSSRDSASKMRRSPPPSDDVDRPSSPHVGGGGGSKQGLPNERNKFGSGSRMPMNDRESASKLHRPTSPSDNNQRPSTPPVGSGGGGSKQTLPNERNKFGPGSRVPTNDRESASKLRRTPSPSDDSRRPTTPPVGSGGGGSKQTLPNERNKFGPGSRVPTNDRESASKLRRTPSPSDDSQRPTTPPVGSGGGSKQALPIERNKFGSGSHMPTSDRESASKLRRPTSPLDNNQRPSTPPIGSGSKQGLPSERNKVGSGSRMPMNDRESASKLRRSPSPPPDSHQSSSLHVGNGGSKQALPTDRNKFGSGSRVTRSDQNSASKPRSPSPSNVRRSSRPISPDNSRPASRKSPTNSKQSVKDTGNDDNDDDDDVVGT